jgi:hypothetical protein
MATLPCPCGRYAIDERERICPFCGILLGPAANSTMQLTGPEHDEGIPRWGTARFHSRMTLLLRVRETGHTVMFNSAFFGERDENPLTLGRKDPDTGERPSLDLTPFGGVEKGVSRRHAAIVRVDHASLQLVDRGSPNGTFLNGQRLMPNQPRILRDGDEIRLGRLVLVLNFQPAVPQEEPA